MKFKNISTGFLSLIMIFLLIGIAAATLESKWDYEQQGWIAKIYAGDLDSNIDNSNSIEVLAGLDRGDLYALTYNGKPKWVYSTGKKADEPVNDFYVSGDTIAMGGDDVYYLASIGTLRWKSSIDGNANSVFIKDLQKDGRKEIIAGSSNNKVYVLDDNGKIKWEYPTNGPVQAVYAEDIDQDNSIEVIAGSGFQDKDTGAYLGDIYVLDKNGNLKWKYEIPVKSLAVSDLANDGFYEIIAGSLQKGIYALDGKGILKWKFETDKAVAKVYADDINNDNLKEILAGSPPFLYAINKDGKEVWRKALNGSVYDIFVTDIDDDGTKEVLVGSHIYAYMLDSKGNVLEKWRMPNKDAEIKGVYASDLYNTGRKNIILGYNWLQIYGDRSERRSNLGVFEVKTAGNEIPVGDADSLYGQAEEFYLVKRYDTAQEYAKKAKENYLKSGNNDMVLRSDVLLLKASADSSYLKAENSFTSMDYENSIKSARDAKANYLLFQKKLEDSKAVKDYKSWIASSQTRVKVYADFENTDWVAKTDIFIDKAESYQKAEGYYQKAQKYYENGNYESASEYAQMAKNIYKLFNDESSMNRVSRLISPAQSSSAGNSLLPVIGVLAVIILIAIFLLRKRGKNVEVIKEKKEGAQRKQIR